MRLEGSCHCGAVTFSVQSRHPVPFERCYCSICRKTGGGGGYAINLEADAATLEVVGRGDVKVYQAMIDKGGERTRSRHERHFCGKCGSHLWAYNEQWPELCHPMASAIDTPLPTPPAHDHMMLAFKAPWVAIEGKPGDPQHDAYPSRSLADWHDQNEQTVD